MSEETILTKCKGCGEEFQTIKSFMPKVAVKVEINFCICCEEYANNNYEETWFDSDGDKINEDGSKCK